jgi:transposase InsO family protein
MAVMVRRILRTGALPRRSSLVRGYAITDPASAGSSREAPHARCRTVPSPYASQRLAPSYPFGSRARHLPRRFRPDHRPRLGVDLTTVPTASGLWTSWGPFALPQVWPFCWWLAVIVDHCSRRVMGFAIFRCQPTSAAVRGFLGRLFRSHQPRWCRRRGIRQRFGAIGKYGSLAVIERCIRTLKHECTRRLILVPYRLAAMEQELAHYFSRYNGHRPHSRLGAATPDEVYHHRRPSAKTPRFEPRPRWPRRSPCASPQALICGQPGVALHLVVRYHGGRRHLPVVTLQPAA